MTDRGRRILAYLFLSVPIMAALLLHGRVVILALIVWVCLAPLAMSLILGDE